MKIKTFLSILLLTCSAFAADHTKYGYGILANFADPQSQFSGGGGGSAFTGGAITSPILAGVGTCGAPSYSFTGHVSSGLLYTTGHGPTICDASTPMMVFDSNQGVVVADGNGLLFSPNVDGSSAKVVIPAASPTISSGFGTTPSVTVANTSASFRINVGTGGTATAGIVGMPTATTGWNCSVENLTAQAGNRADNTVQTASTTNTVSVQNQTKSTGAAIAWTASDIIALVCFPN